jgi:hypothetical protein
MYSYALARMGDKEQRKYVLDSLMKIGQFIGEDFAYFKDDEMVWKYIETNYFSKERYPILSDFDIHASLKTMSDVYPYIKSVPKELEYSDSFKTMEEEYRWAKNLYEWLMANKRKVKFDYEGEKEFSW